MKTVCKKLFSLMLVAVLLVSAIPFQAFAATGDPVTVYFRIDNEAESFSKTGKAKIGKSLGSLMPSSSTVATTYNGLYSDGKVFTGKWELADGPKAGYEITKSTTLSEDMRNGNGDIGDLHYLFL